jgi:arylsulfatase A-like enzyme
MSQTGTVRGFRPQMQGRMVRTDRYKYCVYEFGNHRESLVDMKEDPLESKNLAEQEDYRNVLIRHRRLLQRSGEQHNDALVAELLPNNVGPRPFVPAGQR